MQLGVMVAGLLALAPDPTVVAVQPLALALAPVTVPVLALAADPTALIVQADAAHEDGRFGEAADLYRSAYDAMTTDEKAVLADVIVAAALDDLHAAYRDSSDPRLAARAEELLDAYAQDMGQPLPEADRHRAWIEAAAREAEAPRSADTTAPVPAVDERPPRRVRRRRPTPDADADPPPRQRELVGPVLVGVGVAVLAGGTGFIGAGAPAGRRAERIRDQGLSDPRFTSLAEEDPRRMTHVAAYEDYVQYERGRGQALVAVGSVLSGVGLGLAVYGTVRLALHRRRARRSARIRAVPGGLSF